VRNALPLKLNRVISDNYVGTFDNILSGDLASMRVYIKDIKSYFQNKKTGAKIVEKLDDIEKDITS
jgi:hypothetical protein